MQQAHPGPGRACHFQRRWGLPTNPTKCSRNALTNFVSAVPRQAESHRVAAPSENVANYDWFVQCDFRTGRHVEKLTVVFSLRIATTVFAPALPSFLFFDILGLVGVIQRTTNSGIAAALFLLFLGELPMSAKPLVEYGQLPDDHPFFPVIGQVSAEWAQLEHSLDLIIWDLAAIGDKLGPCLTSQIFGATNRYRTIILLASQLGYDKPLIERIATLMNKTFDVQEKRNRIVHDAWYGEVGGDSTTQYRALPYRTKELGLIEIDHNSVRATIAEIKRRKEQIWELRNALLSAPTSLDRPRTPPPPELSGSGA